MGLEAEARNLTREKWETGAVNSNKSRTDRNEIKRAAGLPFINRISRRAACNFIARSGNKVLLFHTEMGLSWDSRNSQDLS